MKVINISDLKNQLARGERSVKRPHWQAGASDASGFMGRKDGQAVGRSANAPLYQHPKEADHAAGVPEKTTAKRLTAISIVPQSAQ